MRPPLSLLLLLALPSFALAITGGAPPPDRAAAPRPPPAKRRGDLLDPQTCVDNFDIHRDKIIRTEDSREMGAKYLNEVDLGSRDECLRLCCETDTCDVFVFEEKSPGSCYLFNCGPPEDFKCKFTRHTNFSSAVLAVNRHLAELEDQIKLTKHEQDLASLRKQYQEVLTTPKPPTPVPFSPIHDIPSYTSRLCSHYQFQCRAGDECIAIYNACDGIPQCADGSDEAPELGCPTTTQAPQSAAMQPLQPRLPQLPQPAMPQQPLQSLPPRELLPQNAQQQQYGASGGALPEGALPIQKHQPAFMPPIQTQDAQGWPRRLEQIHQSSQMKPYENLGSLHIFNHKGSHQVSDSDGSIPVQYDYNKPMQYEPMPDNNWDRASWQRPQQDVNNNNLNDGSAMYHIDMQQQNTWKPIQNVPLQHRIQSGQNALQVQRRPSPDNLNAPDVPNMVQDRDKMWAVPQMPNQEKQPYNIPMRMVPQQPEETFEPIKVKTAPQPTEKPAEQTVEPSDRKNEPPKVNNNDEPSSQTNAAHKDEKSEIKSTTENKTKKKHSPEHDKTSAKDPFVEEMLVHDGAAERPPGAILLLTLGICMMSIMVVLLTCRIKMARRRMRKNGKSPFAHDADYLVNGMYL